jgi:hypothetical protein
MSNASNVVSFAEESCFSGETFRSVRREVVFTVHIYGLGPEKMLKQDFSADNGIWYDHTDEYLIQILENQVAGPDWGGFVFHPKMDQSAIELIDTDTNKVVGIIHVRRGKTGVSIANNPELSGENGRGNVVSMVSRIKSDGIETSSD